MSMRYQLGHPSPPTAFTNSKNRYIILCTYIHAHSIQVSIHETQLSPPYPPTAFRIYQLHIYIDAYSTYILYIYTYIHTYIHTFKNLFYQCAWFVYCYFKAYFYVYNSTIYTISLGKNIFIYSMCVRIYHSVCVNNS